LPVSCLATLELIPAWFRRRDYEQYWKVTFLHCSLIGDTRDSNGHYKFVATLYTDKDGTGETGGCKRHDESDDTDV